MTPATLVVPRASFDMEEPWTRPEACSAVLLTHSGDGTAPRLQTLVAAWFDHAHLSILFTAADDYVRASYLEHDAPLYEEDVFEAFLAPQQVTSYFELEVSPRGTLFDARITSPDGVRATMHADRAWRCDGLMMAIRSIIAPEGTRTVDTLLRVPFASLGQAVPRDGERWRANFFRIDRHPELGDEYSAWQPTHRQPPDFHVAEAFGVLEFRSSSTAHRA